MSLGGESKIQQNMECEICCESFTKTTRSKVTCPQCNMNTCKKCIKFYLLQNTDQPHCMGCKSKWDRKFVIDSIGKSFYNKEYNKHRKNILFETEKARFPETMPAVERHKNIKMWNEEIQEDSKELLKLRHQLYSLEIKIRRTQLKIKDSKKVLPKKQFIKKCPVEDCEGYLSTSWKCGVCNTKVCSHCFTIKNNEEHKCNKDDLASAELIKKETRSCPSCGIRIFKISGCDQMWCTGCHVAFSWKTGLKVNGVIHNPHFYAWQKENKNNVLNPGAEVCGGIPNFMRLTEVMNYFTQTSTFTTYYEAVIDEISKNDKSWIRYTAPGHTSHQMFIGIQNSIGHIHRGANHNQHVTLYSLRTNCQRNRDNEDLRIKFICKEITEENMKTTLMKREKKNEKNQSELHIYELLGAVFTETILTIYNEIREFNNNNNYALEYETDEQLEQSKMNLKHCFEKIHEAIIKLDKVRIYCNIELCKISKLFNQGINLITGRYFTIKYKKDFCNKELDKKDDMGHLYFANSEPINGPIVTNQGIRV